MTGERRSWTPEEWNAEKRRLNAEYRRQRAERVTDDAVQDCPECGQTRRTPEALRVHRWLAHDVREVPPNA